MDKVSKATRSSMMSAVKGKDTKPERMVRSAVHRAGFRYALHKKDLPGRPDLALTKYRIAVFVHGCFWHGHDCPRGRRPTSNTQFWDKKLSDNISRDQRHRKELSSQGWRVITIWECQIESDLIKLLRILTRLRSQTRTAT